jgi:CHAT domain-containing protein
MSLWNVDDDTTRDLMRGFIRLAGTMPVDKALQRAMQTARQTNPNPALWAGFSVFGTPELGNIAPPLLPCGE